MTDEKVAELELGSVIAILVDGTWIEVKPKTGRIYPLGNVHDGLFGSCRNQAQVVRFEVDEYTRIHVRYDDIKAWRFIDA